MKKMNKPEVEAIRFDSNDVIATSGGGPVYSGIGAKILQDYLNAQGGTSTITIYTNGREYNQSQGDSVANITDYYYNTSMDANTGWYKVVSETSLDGAYYAWFDNNVWYTEPKTYNDTTQEWDTGF